MVVYSALFGPYDILHPTKYNAILYTDQDDVRADGWAIRQVDPPHQDDVKASRYYFSQSHLVAQVEGTEYTIMHGANATLKIHPEELIKYLPPGIDLACVAHPRRKVAQEARVLSRMGKDDPDRIEKQMERYQGEGFFDSPYAQDLSALIVVVRRNTPALQEFEQAWWAELCKDDTSSRDQLSFEYVRWKMDFEITRLPRHWKNYLNLYGHLKKKRDK